MVTGHPQPDPEAVLRPSRPARPARYHQSQDAVRDSWDENSSYPRAPPHHNQEAQQWKSRTRTPKTKP